MSLETRLAALAEAVGADIGSLQAALGIVPITLADFNALDPPSSTVLYVIVDGPVSGRALSWEALTPAEYAALGTPDPAILYILIP